MPLISLEIESKSTVLWRKWTWRPQHPKQHFEMSMRIWNHEFPTEY